MARYETWVQQDLSHTVKVRYLDGNVFSQDNQGNLIGVEVFDKGQAATLTGTVSANVIRADGGTVAVSGTLSGNKAYVILPEAAYLIPGALVVVIKLTSGSAVTTLAAVVSNVYMSSTDVTIDPGTIMPTIETLLAAIAAAVASIPADYSSLWTTLAPAYSTSATYAQGAYVTYNGGLYRCIVAIPAAESWTAAHWTAVKVGGELTTMRNDLEDVVRGIPQNSYETPYSGWENTDPALSEFYVPLTVKEHSVLIASILFVTVFTAACTVSVTIKNKAGTVQYSRKDVTIAASGTKEVYVEPMCKLPTGEYKMYVKSSAGTVAWPYVSTRKYIDDGIISNKGTEYFYNNNGIIFKGAITYLTTDNLSFVENLQKGIQSEDLYLKNPSALESAAVVGNGWTLQGKKCTCNYTASSGNGWVAFKIDRSALNNNEFVFDADLTLQTSSMFRTFIQGKNANTSADLIIGVTIVSQNGHFTEHIDLNHYAVYNDLDLAKDVYYLLGNATAPCYGVADNCELTTENTVLDTQITFMENLNKMRSDIDSNSNAINAQGSDYLVSPNGTKFILGVTNDGTLIAISTIPDKTLFIGNSLLFGNGNFGMCASDGDHDYYHYVTAAITEKNPSATFDKVLGTGFEGAASVSAAETWMNETLMPHMAEDLDLVIVQLGDNVNTAEKIRTFSTTCPELIQFIKTNAPGARVVWAGEWYSSSEKQDIISTACGQNNAEFIDLVPLQSPDNNSYIGAIIDYGTERTMYYNIDSYTDDSANHELTVVFTVNSTQYTVTVPYTSYSVSSNTIAITGNYGFVASPGVASHPGDDGMEAIGNLMIERLGLN